MNKHYVTAVILAAGLGSRMNSDVTKQQLILNNKSILKRCLTIFSDCDLITDIIVVTREEEIDFVKKEISDIDKLCKIIIGGNCRAESARNAFFALNEKCEFIAIHDGVRCLTDASDVKKVIEDAFLYGAATASTEVNDTVKEIDENGFIKFTHNRATMRFVQTPQVFSVDLYKMAIDAVESFDSSITDDNLLMEKIGVSVYCSNTKSGNIKITNQSDFKYAEFLLKGNSENE